MDQPLELVLTRFKTIVSSGAWDSHGHNRTGYGHFWLSFLDGYNLSAGTTVLAPCQANMTKCASAGNYYSDCFSWKCIQWWPDGFHVCNVLCRNATLSEQEWKVMITSAMGKSLNSEIQMTWRWKFLLPLEDSLSNWKGIHENWLTWRWMQMSIY